MKNSKIISLFKKLADIINIYLVAAIFLCFILGDILVCALGFKANFLLFPLIGAALATVVALVLRKFKLLLLAGFLLGMFWCGIYSAELADFPYAEGRAVEMTGKVTELVVSKSNYLTDVAVVKQDETSTTFVLKGVTTDGWQGKVMVSAYGYDLKKGDEIHFIGNVRGQKELHNPYISSRSNYLRNYGAAAYVQAITGELQITALEQVNPVVKFIQKVKDNLYYQMNSLPEKQQQLLKGLAFGDKSTLPDYDRNILSQTGVSHVFAVSGLHVGFVIAFVLLLLRLVGLKFKVPKLLQLILVAIFTLFYAMMCGFAFSVTRAVIMGLLGAAAVVYSENYSAKLALIYAAFICILIQPYAVCDVGFQLSFLATFALLYIYNVWHNLVKSGALATVFAAQFMVMPLVTYYFDVLTLVGLIISPLVTFLAGFVVIFAFLAMLFSLIHFSSLFLFIAGFMAEVIYKVCQWAAALPGSWLCIVKPPILIIILYYVLLFAGCHWLKQWWDAKREQTALAQSSER